MKLSTTAIRSAFRHVHEDEQGAEGAEKVLIIAAIVLPILALLLFFKDAIKDWLKSQWESVKDNDSTNTGTDPGFGGN